MSITPPWSATPHGLRWMLWFAICGCMVLLSGQPVVTAQDHSLPRIEQVSVGFHGVTKVGEWTALRAQIAGPEGKSIGTRITAADIEGRPVQIAGPTLSLSTKPQPVELIYQQGPINSPVLVELLESGLVVASRTIHSGEGLTTLTPQTDLILCLGLSQPGFDAAAAQSEQIRIESPQRVAPLVVKNFPEDQLTHLPLDVRAWLPVDVCVIDAQCKLPDPVVESLRAWIARGGRLLITGGAQIPVLEQAAVAAWCPIQTAGEVTLREISAINSIIPGSSTLRFREGNRIAAQLVTAGGLTLIGSQEGPIIMRSAYGTGTVTVMNLDLNSRPFVNAGEEGPAAVAWDALPEFCRWLAGLKPVLKTNDTDNRPETDLNPTGVSDIQTQLVNTIDRFPEIHRPNYWVVLGLCVLYLLLVGLGDYFLVHKVLRRPELTWITLPLWIALGGFYGMSSARGTTGEQSLARQVDLLTITPELQSARIDTWLTLYENAHRRRSIEWETPPEPNASTTLRWEGRPEPGFRGLFRESGFHPHEAATVLSQNSRRIESWPIRHGSTAIIAATQVTTSPFQVNSDLTDTGAGRLVGTVTLQGPGQVEDWMVAYGNLAFLSIHFDRPAVPSEPLVIDIDACPTKLLNDFVTGTQNRAMAPRHKTGPEYLMVRNTYDPMSEDLAHLFRTLTFHETSGGTNYTSLTNLPLRREDFSHLVRSNRAILFGRWKPAPTASGTVWPGPFRVDDQPLTPSNRESFIRIILPVMPASSTAARKPTAAP